MIKFGRHAAPPPTSSGPVELTRIFLDYVHQNGGIAVTYYYSHQFSEFRSPRPHIYVKDDHPLSRHALAEKDVESLVRINEFILNTLEPFIASDYMISNEKSHDSKYSELMEYSRSIGIEDWFMIPVFGPYNIMGVISIGFNSLIAPTWKPRLLFLEGVASAYHNQIVRYFASLRNEVGLSQREIEVLSWISRGKSSTDIATILGIQRSSVDTYTRRIFQKLGVHNRVGAAISGVTQGLVKLDFDS